MLWVLLAFAIVMLTGDGDDTRAIARLLVDFQQAITEHVPASERRDRALAAIGTFQRAFTRHRRALQEFGRCIEAADRRYRATRAEYDACEDHMIAHRKELARVLDGVQAEYETALSPEERARIASAVTSRPEAWVLEPSLEAELSGTPRAPPRLRGLEGVASARHLTLPRNVASVEYGPLGPLTFAQRYPSRIVEAGMSYEHRDPNVGAAAPDTWHTLLGARFGLFDDVELESLFLPLEIAPDPGLDPLIGAVTMQRRFDGFDLAGRLSLQSPGPGGWAVAPALLAGVPGRRLALLAGLTVPAELGSFKHPQSPTFGMFAPLRVTWNLLPALFVSGETGLAWNDLTRLDVVGVPVALGAGYTVLVGHRLLEVTGAFAWDDLLFLGGPSTASVLEPRVFRITLGGSLAFQAL